jgi:transposase
VGCLGASSFSYAEASPSQAAADFIASHVRAFAYIGGVPRATVPDNLKSGVKRSNRYEPTLGPLYAKLAEHYGFVVLPARVRKPRDKAPVEAAVLHLQRYILGRLRDRTFFSLAAINVAVWELLDQFNDEPMKNYGGMSRRHRFREIDKPALQPLPAMPFRITAVAIGLHVGRNYHVLYEKHHYSVPYALAQQHVDAYRDGGLVEIYHDGVHVARHKHQPPNYRYSTQDEHMPPNHRFVRGWSPDYFIGKGSLIGPRTTTVIREIFARYKHPEQAYKACLGLLALAKHYTPERLEAAAARALHFRAPSYRTLKAILTQGLDQQPLDGAQPDQHPLPFTHENVRGADYYDTMKGTR